MRDKLKDLKPEDYWCYGPKYSDFAYTFRVAEEFIEARHRVVGEKWAKARKEQGEESADDEFDDIAYYAGVEAQYLWHFCLWRMQGSFEGMITHCFLPDNGVKRVQGMKDLLRAMRIAGYTIENGDNEELIQWAKLRNVISHTPPEDWRPGPIKKEDIVEYMELLDKVTKTWWAERDTIVGAEG